MTGGKKKDLPAPASAVDGLFDRVVAILDRARDRVVRSVNSEMVIAYWHIGREIVEHLQAGEDRAEYGKRVIEELSGRLFRRYGRGFSSTNLRYFRTFYHVYADRAPEIRHTPSGVLDDLALAVDHADRIRGFSPSLGWSHYRTLMQVDHKATRLFYEIEAEKQNWSVPQLERQISTLLFARLLKSRDKAGLLELSTRGQVIENPTDALKDPYVLDFLDLPDGETLHESELESAILHKLQAFLLELGKGFAFVARQKRLAFEDEHFYVDLVFYNTILKCFLLIDLKVGKLSHLGIDAKNAAKIEKNGIKRLRPLVPNQPWGIFFVKFEPKRLPVVALRRILSRVALKKRASANPAERTAWAADDLLFVSNYGEGDRRQISFAHFSKAQARGDLPTLKVLGWDNLDTPLHLDDVAEKLTRDLAWPDDEDDVESWRTAWRSAFTLRHSEVITTACPGTTVAGWGRSVRSQWRTRAAWCCRGSVRGGGMMSRRIAPGTSPRSSMRSCLGKGAPHGLQADAEDRAA